MSNKMNTCAICEQTALCEDDHFPVADRHSGSTTWPLCRACHDLTDRVPLYKWSPMLAWGSLARLFEKSDRDERLILVKLFKISADANFAMRHQAKASESVTTKRLPATPIHRPGVPIDYEKRVLASIQEHGAMTRKELVRVTHGKTGRVYRAMQRLVDDGTLVTDQMGRLAERSPVLEFNDDVTRTG